MVVRPNEAITTRAQPASGVLLTRSAFDVRASSRSVMGSLVAAELRELCPRSAVSLLGDEAAHGPAEVIVVCRPTERRMVVFGQTPTAHAVDLWLRDAWCLVTVDSPADEFALAVHCLLEGPSFVSAQIVRALVMAAVGASAGSERLTPRETEVLRLLAEGFSNGEIAAHLHVSPNTVRTHVQSLLTKLEATSRAKVVARAHALGLLA